MQNWVSYADHVVVFSVVADRELPAATPEQIARKEYLIGREATLAIEQRLWSASGAPALPSTITMQVRDGR